MGDLRDWSPEPAVTEDRPAFSSPPPAEIDTICWELAERTIHDIISHVQPTVVSERKRKEVISYVEKLIGDRLGCQVLQFGSVPLKTYLPDGDIDLTALGPLNIDDSLASDVFSVLECEEHNASAMFVVKDVQLIRAEVKLVKCLVQNIVVDISFNQLGGLCTLYFLEQVDRLIGKSNLFKRSIILIKAWCYYESRILGAHHGLISTYALETLVLYIFHHFHSSLNGPLAVLYMFLDIFSKFDWDNYCISLNGPIPISSLPELVAESPENGGGGVLLSKEFLKDSVEMFANPSRVLETMYRTFPQKHLNIVDPLRENNNLGRSVSKGNFFRIRSAFNYGARKLGQILSLQEEILVDEIKKFFSNTLDRNRNDSRPDVQNHVPPSLENETNQDEFSFSGLGSIDLKGMIGQSRVVLEESFSNAVNNVQILSKEIEPEDSMIECDANKTAAFSVRLSGEENDLATPQIEDLKISNDVLRSSVGKAYHAPHSSYVGNGELRSENPDHKMPDSPNTSLESVNHVKSLQYSRSWHEYIPNALTSHMPSHLVTRFHSKEAYDGALQWHPQIGQDMLPHKANGFVHHPTFYPQMNHSIVRDDAFGREEKSKPRGTGMYFPNTSNYRDRPITPRGRNAAPLRSPRHNIETMSTPHEINSNCMERNPCQWQFPHLIKQQPPGSSSLDDLPRSDNNSSISKLSESSSSSSSSICRRSNQDQNLKSQNQKQMSGGSSVIQDKSGKQTYQLKDQDDFPPLSV